MAVGDTMIDEDHQRLIGLINAIELVLQAAGGKAELTPVLAELALYTQAHFEREERLMRHLSYNGLIHHRQAHRDLRTRLATLSIDIAAAKERSVEPAEIERIVQLLRAWLLDHVLKEDMLLKAFLLEVS